MQSTSLDAYHNIVKPKELTQLEKVEDAIRTLVCPTNMEISGYTKLPINEVTARTNYLVHKRQSVVEYETRECTVTGHDAKSWRVV